MFGTSKVFHVNAKSQRAFAAKQGDFSTVCADKQPSFAEGKGAEKNRGTSLGTVEKKRSENSEIGFIPRPAPAGQLELSRSRRVRLQSGGNTFHLQAIS